MTVRELITELQKLPKKAIVALASDAEGNSFSVVEDIVLALYFADAEEDMQIIDEEEAEDYYSEDEIVRATPAVILFPRD